MELPNAFPDELLLGRLIRYITLSGEQACAFCSIVFGSSRISIHPFLTAGIDRLAKATGENAEGLLYRHTLAPLFFFYIPQHAEQLKKFLLGHEAAKALRESQFPSFGSGHSVCLKWCPLCAKQDLQEFGVAYWHLSHQIPGITACYQHPAILHRADLSGRQRLIAGLLPTCTEAPLPSTKFENAVAKFGHELMGRLTETQPTIDLGFVYRSRLDDLGYITSAGRVRRKTLMRHFIADAVHYGQNQDSPLPRGDCDYRYISELLEAGGSHHPFRHLLLGAWLFESPDEIFHYRPPFRATTSPQPKESSGMEVEQRCLEFLMAGYSLAEVHRKTGKSRCYLRRLARMGGIELNLKPKLLDNTLQQRIIKLARFGVHRRRISKICSIGIGSVEQVISSEPGLVEWRKKCHWESKRRRCRVRLQRYLSHHPLAIRQQVKEECCADYFWLYLNDRSWLDLMLPNALPPCGRI